MGAASRGKVGTGFPHQRCEWGLHRAEKWEPVFRISDVLAADIA